MTCDVINFYRDNDNAARMIQAIAVNYVLKKEKLFA